VPIAAHCIISATAAVYPRFQWRERRRYYLDAVHVGADLLQLAVTSCGEAVQELRG